MSNPLSFVNRMLGSKDVEVVPQKRKEMMMSAERIQYEIVEKKARFAKGTKRGLLETFEGYIKSAADRHAPKSGFSMEREWSVIMFTRINSEEKRKIVGSLPYVQKHVVYKMKIQEVYDPKHDWGWHIFHVAMSPPYHDPKQLMLFTSLFATMNPEYASSLENKKIFKTTLSKSYKKELAKENPDWKAWFSSLACSNDILQKSQSANSTSSLASESKSKNAEGYPLISQAYDSRQLFYNNLWWDTLPDSVKSIWEENLAYPDKAFRMCFRETMPDELKYLHYNKKNQQYNQQDDAVESDENQLFLQQKKTNTKDHDSDSSSQLLRDMMVCINRLSTLNTMQRSYVTRKTSKIIQFVPEISLEGFKALASHFGWTAKHLTNEEYLELPTLSRAKYKYVANLNEMLVAISAYDFYNNSYEIHDAKACALSIQDVPIVFRPGMKLLAETGVLKEKIPSLEEESQQNALFFYTHWFDAKQLLLQTLLHRVKTSTQLIKVKKQPHKAFAKADKSKWTVDDHRVVDSILKHPIVFIVGKAGTGKTEKIKVIKQIFRGTSVVSYTGRACDVIAERVPGIDESTVHSRMYQPNIMDKNHDLLLVDETSMLTELLFMQLISLVSFTRLVIMGDPNQIPAFGEYKGAVLRELMNSFPCIELEINYRQLKDPTNLILENAFAVLRQETKLKFDKTSFINRNHDGPRGLLHFINTHKSNFFQNAIIICAKSKTTVPQINKIVVQELRKMRGIPIVENQTEHSFCIGDRLVFNKKVWRQKDDELDDIWNQAYYKKSNQRHRDSRYLYRNGNTDEIIGLFEILDHHQVASYYRKFASDVARKNRKEEEQQQEQKIEQHSLPEKWIRKLTIHDCFIKSKELIVPASEHNMIIQCRSGKWIRLSDPINHGYALTVNKTQGGSYDHVALFTPGYTTDRFLSKVFGVYHLYTAITRAIKSFTYLGGNKPIEELQSMILQKPIDLCCLHLLCTENQRINEQQQQVSEGTVEDDCDADDEHDEAELESLP